MLLPLLSFLLTTKALYAQENTIPEWALQFSRYSHSWACSRLSSISDDDFPHPLSRATVMDAMSCGHISLDEILRHLTLEGLHQAAASTNSQLKETLDFHRGGGGINAHGGASAPADQDKNVRTFAITYVALSEAVDSVDDIVDSTKTLMTLEPSTSELKTYDHHLSRASKALETLSSHFKKADNCLKGISNKGLCWNQWPYYANNSQNRDKLKMLMEATDKAIIILETLIADNKKVMEKATEQFAIVYAMALLSRSCLVGLWKLIYG